MGNLNSWYFSLWSLEVFCTADEEALVLKCSVVNIKNYLTALLIIIISIQLFLWKLNNAAMSLYDIIEYLLSSVLQVIDEILSKW